MVEFVDINKDSISRRRLAAVGAGAIVGGVSSGYILANLIEAGGIYLALKKQTPLEDLIASAKVRPYPFGVISVLGAGLIREENTIRPDNDGMMRLAAGDFAFSSRLAPRMVFHGGPDSRLGNPATSLVMQSEHQRFYKLHHPDSNYPEALVDTEASSHNTVTNVLALGNYMNDRGIRRAIIFTSNQHVLGAALNVARWRVKALVYSADYLVQLMDNNLYAQFRETGQMEQRKLIHEAERFAYLTVDPSSWIERRQDH